MVGSRAASALAPHSVRSTGDRRQLVGTDLVQAVPLVASAALGHVIFGDFQLALTTSLLAGSIPGVWLGAHMSARAPGGLVRRALGFVLLASALKLLDVSTAFPPWRCAAARTTDGVSSPGKMAVVTAK